MYTMEQQNNQINCNWLTLEPICSNLLNEKEQSVSTNNNKMHTS